jgi:predicted permease
MIWFLRLLFFAVFCSMVAVTSWASLHQSLFSIPAAVRSNPWFIATLFDAYFGFLTFYVWVAWKEPGFVARILWFFAVMLLGNLAMAAYMIGELFRIKDVNQLPEMLARRNPGRLLFPALLTVAAVAIYVSAWNH